MSSSVNHNQKRDERPRFLRRREDREYQKAIKKAIKKGLPGVPEGSVCDCCDKPSTKVMTRETSDWCAEWYWGYYCDDCFAGVEAAMRKDSE